MSLIIVLVTILLIAFILTVVGDSLSKKKKHEKAIIVFRIVQVMPLVALGVFIVGMVIR